MNMMIRELDGGAPVIDTLALEQFQRQWATYQKLVDSDILSHNAVGKLLHDTLIDEFKKPFSFLDIACGDAHRMAETLAGTQVARYRGIDLSEPALELAAGNLRDVPFEVELDHGDFIEVLRLREPTDFAWCGLSIHHLQRDEKKALFSSLRASTRSSFLLYEPTCRDGESRDGYMERWVRVNNQTLTMLTPEERAQIANHVTTCDYPETSAGWCEIGLEAGFARARELYCEPTGFYRVYRFDC
jgi:ubiquinone/menaquinone biosynthesis C-methylase UbiE